MDIECSVVDHYRICKKGEIMMIGQNTSAPANAVPDQALLQATIHFPSEFNGTKITEIGLRAFFNVTTLINVTLGQYVRIIHESAFRHCTGLETIIIPSTVEYIGEGGIRKASTDGEASVSPFKVVFLPDSQLDHLENCSISGSLNITLVYCGCRQPSYFSDTTFLQVQILNFFSPAPMKFLSFHSKINPAQCYFPPVYDKYHCRCTVHHKICTRFHFPLVCIAILGKK